MILASGRKLKIGAVNLHGHVTRDYDGELTLRGADITTSQVDSAYRAWTERARAQWAEYRSQGVPGALDSLRAWAERHPLTVSTTFDNEAGPDFSRIFEEAPVIEGTPADSARLRDYAMRLRDLMARKDTAALVEEFLPLLWEGQDSLNVEQLRSNFTEEQIQSVREHIVLDDAYLDIRRSDVGLRRWADGRVWELYYEPDGNALFVSRTLREGTEEYTGMGGKREVYVAELGGELKVVR
jgi:hypothetical protein